MSARVSATERYEVVATGEPVVTLSALDDERMANFLSVHQLNVQSVACVPIRAPEGSAVGALYLGPCLVGDEQGRLYGTSWRGVPLRDCRRIVTTVSPGGCSNEDIVFLEAK